MSNIQSLLERMSILLDEERRCVEAGQLTQLELLARRKAKIMADVERELNALSTNDRQTFGVRGLPVRDSLIALLKNLKKKQDDTVAIVSAVLSRASAQLADTQKLKAARASYATDTRRLSSVDRST